MMSQSWHSVEKMKAIPHHKISSSRSLMRIVPKDTHHNQRCDIVTATIQRNEEALKQMIPGFQTHLASIVNTELPRNPSWREHLWDKFEYIACVCFTGYKDRYEQLKKELDRVGISRAHIHWDFPSPYKEVLLKSVPMTPFNKKNGCFYIGYNNYKAIATAYYLGCKSILVMEDDVRFLKNINLIANVLGSLPDDFDLAMLDHNMPGKMEETDYLKIFTTGVNPYWSRFSYLTSSGCYAMSRKCMESWLRVYERPAHGSAILRNNDGYFRKEYLGVNANLYAARIPPALQFAFSGCHCKSMERYYRLHAVMGASTSLYEGFKT